MKKEKSEYEKNVLALRTPVKVWLGRQFFGEEVYLGRGKVTGRVVYGSSEADYTVEFNGAEACSIASASKEPGRRPFRIKPILKKEVKCKPRTRKSVPISDKSKTK